MGWGGSSEVQVSHLPSFRVWKPNFKPQKKSFGIFDTFSYYLLLTTITINYLFLFYPSSPAFAIFLDTKRKWWCYVQKNYLLQQHTKKSFPSHAFNLLPCLCSSFHILHVGNAEITCVRLFACSLLFFLLL